MTKKPSRKLLIIIYLPSTIIIIHAPIHTTNQTSVTGNSSLTSR
ncbi:MAG: hypothetical protein SPF35_04290 [Prevotella sp.]|nr:hypothetical protein [Prevotella sp.]MDY2805104.1 hypothetical protein [Prevotella sp.]MDY3966153.1 hypothetical protein [Prevotella sp.]MDY5288419.1 hypothetical protein [Prevotella sp.]MDY5680728.1 hypothetical protein [Prevotella sp.]